LSYQPKTLTRLPLIWVSAGSKTQEDGSPITSRDTIGACETRRTPRSAPWAAVSNASLTSSRVTGRFRTTVRSVSEPSSTGTRTAIPSSAPASSGRTRPTARAAPVPVGMMLRAAERARRRSLCGPSISDWSFV